MGPPDMDVAIMGAGVAGLAAALAIKRVRPNLRVKARMHAQRAAPCLPPCLPVHVPPVQSSCPCLCCLAACRQAGSNPYRQACTLIGWRGEG